MVFDILSATDEVSKPFSKVVHRKMAYKRLRIPMVPLGELDWVSKYDFEKLKRVFVHERWSSHGQLIKQNSECVPVGSSSVTHAHNYLRSHVLGCPAKSVSALPRFNFLDKSEVSQLDVPVLLNEYVLWLQVPVY